MGEVAAPTGTASATPTGRLFRSLKAEGDAANAAVPALALDQAVGLRTVTLGDPIVAPPLDEPAPTQALATPVIAEPVGAAVPVAAAVAAWPAAPAPAPPAPVAPAPVAPAPVAPAVIAPAPPIVIGAVALDAPEPEPDRAIPQGRGAHAAPGIRAIGVWLVVIGVTVVVAFGDALVVGRNGLGWVTGIALLLSSIYGAIVVRSEDYAVAVIAPPLAFFLATLTAGQLTLLPSGSLLLREALMIVTTLGANAAWIFGSTAVALAIVLFRRWRSRRSA